MRKNMPLELPLVVAPRMSLFLVLPGHQQPRHLQCRIPAGIILWMYAANERWCYIATSFLIGWTHQGSFCECTQPMRHYIVTSSLNGWMHTQNDPCNWSLSPCMRKNFYPPPLSKIDVKKLYEMQICFYLFFSQKNSAPGVMYLESGTN